MAVVAGVKFRQVPPGLRFGTLMVRFATSHVKPATSNVRLVTYV